MILLLLVVFFLIWAGVTLIIDAWMRREGRPDLTERLRPFQPQSLADEAQEWLQRQER